MVKVQRLKSILLKDGKKFAVDYEEWGEMTLQGQDLLQFRNDVAEVREFFAPQIQSGDMQVTPLLENVQIDGNNQSIEVGIQIQMSENFVDCPKEIEILQRMSQDPNIIKYNHHTPIE